MSKDELEQQHTQTHFNTNISDSTSANEALAVITEEQDLPTRTPSSIITKTSKSKKSDVTELCVCKKAEEIIANEARQINAELIQNLLKKKELELRAEYDKILEKERALLKERFDFILANEQTRASYMLREAHRDRQEKITALKSQLECKNLAALMYVMCTERRRSKLEKLRIIQDYTNYIHELQDILYEGQELILHLSRGYKTAARVDYEWREKMKKIVSEFLSFIYHFAGGSPESNQYFLDLPKLLKIESATVDDPDEDPCEEEEVAEEQEEVKSSETPQEKPWWDQLEGESRPFVLFGDMADFEPKKRREIIRNVKAAKTAPKKWRHYVFNDMYFNPRSCSNMENIKDIYPKKEGHASKWECHGLPDIRQISGEDKYKNNSKMSLNNSGRRTTGQSVDIRGNMGSLLKIIATAHATQTTPKTALLGARDSIEIASATKLRERNSIKPPSSEQQSEPKEVVLAVGRRRTSLFEQARYEPEESPAVPSDPIVLLQGDVEEDVSTLSALGSHNDSLEVVKSQPHVPDIDHKIFYERVCPTEQCQRLQVDSFMRSLPPYMRASPFMHFEQNFEEYETCSPEQLEILRRRLECKKAKDAIDVDTEGEPPLAEWQNRGVAVQTSELSLSLPPCTCFEQSSSILSSNFVFNFEDLLPVKQAMDAIHKECLFDDSIEFDRFKVVGQDSKEAVTEKPKNEFKEIKYNEIKEMLQKHPSLLDIFEAMRC